jgi:sarcosine oxidase, subunit gamma
MADALRDIVRRPPLGGSAIELTTGTAPDVLLLRRQAPRARFILRIDAARLPAGGEVAGFALDMPSNRFRSSVQRAALRLGPDEWLLWAPEEETGRIAAEVAAALSGGHFSLVDISQGRAAFALSGAEAASVLNAGCPLDLSPAAFPPGAATRTLIGKCEVVLVLTDDRPTFEVECARSFAPYLRDFLLEAARGLRARS